MKQSKNSLTKLPKSSHPSPSLGEGEVVVFLIGMRVNRWWQIHKWFPTAMVMPKMLRELDNHPEIGYLGGHSWFGRTTIMVQYWRSREALYAYARDREAEHLPAWRKFNKHVKKSGAVGLWHETYVVPRSQIKSVYVNMPAFGLGAALAEDTATQELALA